MRILAVAFIAASIVSPAAAGVSGNYYEEFAPRNCGAGLVSGCEFDFPAFPASLNGKFVTITSVACDMYTANPLTRARLSVNGRRFHPVNVPERAGDLTFREPVNMKIAAGSGTAVKLTLNSLNAGGISASCVIVGTITAN